MLFRLFSLAGEELSQFYKIPFGTYRYQFVNIPAGGTAIIYFYANWGEDFRAFIERVGFGPAALPWANVLFTWEIDREVVEVYNYQLANVTNPKQFRDHYVARREIVWRGTNNDVLPHIFEVLCDGMLVMKPKAKVKYRV